MLKRSLIGLLLLVLVAAVVTVVVKEAQHSVSATAATTTNANATAATTTTQVPLASLFPKTVAAGRWTGGQVSVSDQVTFDTTISLGSNGSKLCENVSKRVVEWSIWCSGGGTIYPVVSNDGGRIWSIGGPDVSSDWAGGSVYDADRVSACSATTVAMTGYMADVTFNGGHAWNQLFPSEAGAGADEMQLVNCGGGAGASAYQMAIRETINQSLPQDGSYAIYVTRDNGRVWTRISQHVI